MAKHCVVRVAEAAEQTIIRESEIAAPLEAGGILLGMRLDDGPWILDAVTVAGESSRRSFTIPRGATSAAVEAARAKDRRLGYVGDWHSHPSDVDPSERDMRTLATLAQGAIHGSRVIAIARRIAMAWQLEVWVQGRLRLPRQCNVLRTGGLPPGDG